MPFVKRGEDRRDSTSGNPRNFVPKYPKYSPEGEGGGVEVWRAESGFTMCRKALQQCGSDGGQRPAARQEPLKGKLFKIRRNRKFQPFSCTEFIRIPNYYKFSIFRRFLEKILIPSTRSERVRKRGLSGVARVFSATAGCGCLRNGSLRHSLGTDPKLVPSP